MAHAHPHTHHHPHGGNKAVLRVSFFIIAAFMLVEIAGGWLTRSLALLSDAGHMFSDAFSLAMALWAFKIGEKRHTLQKTFGYKRFEILAAALNGVLLVLIALLIVYEALKRFADPPEIATGGMLAVSILGLLVNAGVAAYMAKNSDTRGNINMRGAYLHVISDMLGSIGAVAAALLMMVFGWGWADPLAGILVALLIGRSGWLLCRQALHILMEGAPENIPVEQLLATIGQVGGVESVHDVHVWTISSNINMLSCHIVVDGSLTVSEAERIVYQIEHILPHHHIVHSTIQIESSKHPHQKGVLCSFDTGGDIGAHSRLHH